MASLGINANNLFGPWAFLTQLLIHENVIGMPLRPLHTQYTQLAVKEFLIDSVIATILHFHAIAVQYNTRHFHVQY